MGPLNLVAGVAVLFSCAADLSLADSPAPTPTWEQLGLNIDGDAIPDRFGESVSYNDDGTIVAVGAPQNESTEDFPAGYVRVFKYSKDGGWEQMGNDIDGEVEKDHNGVSVAITDDGMRVAIGAWGSDVNGENAGQARVFDYSMETMTWVQIGSDLNGDAAGDKFGYSIAISGDGYEVAIGAPGTHPNSGIAGYVRAFQIHAGGAWEQMGQDLIGAVAADEFGWSVSLSRGATVLAVGARANNGNGNNAGHVRVFEYSRVTGMWTQMGSDIEGEAAGDWSGKSVSLSGTGMRLAIGAYHNAGNGVQSGHVRVFYYSSANMWEQMGGDIDGEAAGDYAGRAVSLSHHGNIVAIGSPQNANSGVHAGQVRVFQYHPAGGWQQLGQNIDGEAAGDRSGGSVSLSGDGMRVCIGSVDEDQRVGHVRCFELTEGASTPTPTPTPTCPDTSDLCDICREVIQTETCGGTPTPPCATYCASFDGKGAKCKSAPSCRWHRATKLCTCAPDRPRP